MGTPSRLRVLFGEHTVDARRMQPVERWTALLRIIDMCKPRFAYMPAFLTLRDHLQSQYGRERRILPPRAVCSKDADMLQVRCAYLASVAYVASAAIPSDKRRKGRVLKSTQQIERIDLYVTQKGRLLLLTQSYSCVVWQRGSTYPETEYVARSIVPEYLEEPTGQEYITPDVFLWSCSNLQADVDRCVRDREQRLGDMRTLQQNLKVVCQRLGSFETNNAPIW